jgi:hypothetical protein
LAHSLGAVFNGQYNSFVIHSHLFSLENIFIKSKRQKNFENQKKPVENLQNQLLKSGEF